jgi:hypothetical protein
MNTMIGRYDATRRDLAALLGEFEDAAYGPESYPPLFYHLIWFGEPLTARLLSAFQTANTKKGGDWQKWDEFPGGDPCGRFFGFERSLSAFMSMAQRGMEILTRIRELRNAEDVFLPADFTIDLTPYQGHLAWIYLVFETARAYSTPILRTEPCYWGCTGQVNDEEPQVYAKTEDGIAYPDHPPLERLSCNLFEASDEAIRLWLNPSEAVTIGDPIIDTPPIRLPPEPEQNGPQPPNVFWLWGKRYTFSPKPWDLLSILWGGGKVKKEDAMLCIYQADDAERKFTSTVKHLQHELGAQDCPAAVYTKREYIWLEYDK